MDSNLPRAACVLIVRDDKVLSVSRKDNESDFGLPGGKVEEGETDRHAAARETFEETGVIVSAMETLYSGMDNGRWCTTFLAQSYSGEPYNSEAGMVSWVYPEQLMNGQFATYNRLVIEAWKQRLGNPRPA